MNKIVSLSGRQTTERIASLFEFDIIVNSTSGRGDWNASLVDHRRIEYSFVLLARFPRLTTTINLLPSGENSSSLPVELPSSVYQESASLVIFMASAIVTGRSNAAWDDGPPVV